MFSALLLIPVILLFQPAASPKFSARLYAAHQWIQPGGQTELAIELEIEKGWHIYHPIILDTGAPTTVTFELPPGLTVGELQFPAPYLGKEYDLEYLALSGRITVLTTLELVPDAATDAIPIKAQVFALACKELCLPVRAEATLTLKVASEPPPPANEEFFRKARASIPRPLEKAEYLEGSRVLARHTAVPIGQPSELVAEIRVRPGHHIQDRDPGVPDLVPSRLFIQAHDGIKLEKGNQAWPLPRIHEVKDLGRVREQAGQVLIRTPFVVDDLDFKPGRVRLSVLFQYQACRDGGVCYPPMLATGSVEFDVLPAGQAAVANPDPLVAGLTPVGPGPAQPAPAERSLPVVFLFALIGGVILNVMPCVLPVISLKVFGFVRQAGDDPRRVLRMGLVYAAGILASFAVLAFLMVTFRLAWGGLMQRPEFLIGLSAVVFAFALSLLGVYELQLPGAAADAASAAASKEGYAGAFFSGVMTTLLATPCVGPFLGSAVGVLSRLPSPTAATGIMVVGVGFAAPYVLLTAFPAWLRYLPKPGPWMVTFKQAVGFILVGVVLWLLSILIRTVDPEQMLGTLGLLCSVSLGCWLLGKITLSDSRRRSVTLLTMAMGVTVGGGWVSFEVFSRKATRIPWQDWEPGIAERLSAQGYAVYVDYTAEWCLTCQTNKKLVLESERVSREFARLGIYPIRADFTRFNPQMQSELQRHGRNGVPLNVVLPPGRPDQPIVLPELLTAQTVLDALARIQPSRTTPSFWSDSRYITRF